MEQEETGMEVAKSGEPKRSAQEQESFNQEMAKAWSEDRYEEANAWIKLGADPMSVKEPILSISVSSGLMDRALALAPHRWREALESPLSRLVDNEGYAYGAALNPLHRCVGQISHPEKSLQLLELLIALGANPNAHSSSWGRGYSLAELAIRSSDMEALSVVIKGGADIGVICDSGNSLLHVAIESWSPEAARALVEAGIDRSMKNDRGQRAEDLLDAAPPKQRAKLVAYFGALDAAEEKAELEGELAIGKRKTSTRGI